MREQTKILELLHARSEQALQQIHASYGALCHSIAGRILARHEDVEEVVSDALLVVWEHIPPEQPRSLRAYISRITHNLALNRLRYNQAESRDERLVRCMEELELCLPAHQSPEDALEAKEITRVINAYLATVPQVNRDIFVRRYYCMETPEEIADAMGLSRKAVNARLIRMRTQLRASLEKEGITP